MKTWAETEVRLACENERRQCNGDEAEYGIRCYESALKAFKCLLEDNHSGMSIQITKQILNRLIDHKPLTPITNSDDEWFFAWDDIELHTSTYKDLRVGGLYKTEYQDGRIEVSDIRRVFCKDINNPNATFTNSFITDIVDKMYPITLPYMPYSEPIIVYTEDFLYDTNLHYDSDTLAVYHLDHPEYGKEMIGRYFKDIDGKFVEIDVEEFIKRKAEYVKRISTEKGDRNDDINEEETK